jgi:PTS system nitrogen regulatory IIA component
MGNELMTVDQLAAYLHRDAREVGKLASRGQLPGHKVSGQWRFALAEINNWLETQMPSLTEAQLLTLETAGGARQGNSELLLPERLAEASVAVPLRASTRASVLKELVVLAEQSWHVYDPDAVLEAVRAREELGSTALPSGVAIPHPRRPLPAILGESVIAYGRTLSGIPFGAPRGELTDIFFLVCCREDATHLRVLARLTRLLMREGFLDALRQAETPAESRQLILDAEQQLLQS